MYIYLYATNNQNNKISILYLSTFIALFCFFLKFNVIYFNKIKNTSFIKFHWKKISKTMLEINRTQNYMINKTFAFND